MRCRSMWRARPSVTVPHLLLAETNKATGRTSRGLECAVLHSHPMRTYANSASASDGSAMLAAAVFFSSYFHRVFFLSFISCTFSCIVPRPFRSFSFVPRPVVGVCPEGRGSGMNLVVSFVHTPVQFSSVQFSSVQPRNLQPVKP